jgi:hypothetical protein
MCQPLADRCPCQGPSCSSAVKVCNSCQVLRYTSSWATLSPSSITQLELSREYDICYIRLGLTAYQDGGNRESRIRRRCGSKISPSTSPHPLLPDRYNPSNVSILEDYLYHQIRSQEYDCLANLAILKLYVLYDKHTFGLLHMYSSQVSIQPGPLQRGCSCQYPPQIPFSHTPPRFQPRTCSP